MDTGDGAQVNIIWWSSYAKKGNVKGSFIVQSGEDTDRELDCMLELPAARKPLNSPEEVALKFVLFWL